MTARAFGRALGCITPANGGLRQVNRGMLMAAREPYDHYPDEWSAPWPNLKSNNWSKLRPRTLI